MENVNYPFLVGALETAMEFIPMNAEFLSHEDRKKLDKLICEKIKGVYKKEKDSRSKYNF